MINHAIAIGRAGGAGGIAEKIESDQMSRSKERPLNFLNEELETLNAQARKLEETIARNAAEILED